MAMYTFLVAIIFGYTCHAESSLEILNKYKQQHCTQGDWPSTLNDKCKSAESFADLNAIIDKQLTECSLKTGSGSNAVDSATVISCTNHWKAVKKDMDSFFNSLEVLNKYKQQHCTQEDWPSTLNDKCKSAGSFGELDAIVDKQMKECSLKTGSGSNAVDSATVISCTKHWKTIKKDMDTFFSRPNLSGRVDDSKPGSAAQH